MAEAVENVPVPKKSTDELKLNLLTSAAKGAAEGAVMMGAMGGLFSVLGQRYGMHDTHEDIELWQSVEPNGISRKLVFNATAINAAVGAVIFGGFSLYKAIQYNSHVDAIMAKTGATGALQP